MPVTPKPWYESATLWFNLASLIVVVAGLLADPSMGADPRVVSVAAVVVTVGNAALRVLKTAQPIAGSPTSPPSPH